MSHGAYSDGKNVLNVCDLTRDKQKLVDFVKNTPNTGGSYEEAYEYVLSEVQDLDWKDISNKVLVMIGDANPGTPN